MLTSNDEKPEWASASPLLSDAYIDFILSRQAMLCGDRTIEWYSFTLGKVMEWLVQNEVAEPNEISARHVRAYLSELAVRGLTDSTINNHARAIRTMLRFFHAEKYISEPVNFKMPSIAEKRLPFLVAEDVQKLLKASQISRDKALILLMVDTGLRRAEVCALNWGDVDISSGLVRVVRGKGGKARSVVVGAATRRALLAYRRDLDNSEPTEPLFQTKYQGRLSFNGLRSILLRVGKRAGVKVNPHSLRRTFATMSLKADMNPLHLQGLLGHASMEMTKRYIQMVDDDLLDAHREHGPIDNILYISKK